MCRVPRADFKFPFVLAFFMSFDSSYTRNYIRVRQVRAGEGPVDSEAIQALKEGCKGLNCQLCNWHIAMLRDLLS